MNENLKKNQVYKVLRDMILNGSLAPGARLSGENQLAVNFKVSRVTLRESLDMLVQDQLLDRVPRKGTYVSRNISGGSYLVIAGEYQNDLSSPVRYILSGLEKRVGEAGRSLEYCSQQFIQGLDADSAARIFKKNRIGGVFLIEENFIGNEKELLLLKGCGLPVVVPHGLAGDRIHYDFPMLLSDFRQAFGDGVRHLAALGHQRVGTITLKAGMHSGQYCRGYSLQDYLELLEYNHLDTDESLLECSTYDYEKIRMAVRRMIFGPRPPSAIICYSDFLAIHVYKVLKEMKIRIPEQVSVMGFCGFPGGHYLEPPLSTVDLCYSEIGVMAAELMFRSGEWYEKGGSPLTVFTPHQVVERKSTGPLGGSGRAYAAASGLAQECVR